MHSCFTQATHLVLPTGQANGRPPYSNALDPTGQRIVSGSPQHTACPVDENSHLNVIKI